MKLYNYYWHTLSLNIGNAACYTTTQNKHINETNNTQKQTDVRCTMPTASHNRKRHILKKQQPRAMGSTSSGQSKNEGMIYDNRVNCFKFNEPWRGIIKEM